MNRQSRENFQGSKKYAVWYYNRDTCHYVVQLPSHVQLFAITWSITRQASLSFTIPWSLLKLMSIESEIVLNHLILCCPFSLLPPIFPSIRIFSNESVLCIRWPKYQSFSFSIYIHKIHTHMYIHTYICIHKIYIFEIFSLKTKLFKKFSAF